MQDRERSGGIDDDVTAVADVLAIADSLHAHDLVAVLEYLFYHRVVVELDPDLVGRVDDSTAVLPSIDDGHLSGDGNIEDDVLFRDLEAAMVHFRVRHRRFDLRLGNDRRKRVGTLDGVPACDVAGFLRALSFEDDHVVPGICDGRGGVGATGPRPHDHDIVLQSGHTSPLRRGEKCLLHRRTPNFSRETIHSLYLKHVVSMVGDFETILVPTAGSGAAKRAGEHAADIAKRYDGTVHTLYVMEMGRGSSRCHPISVRHEIASRRRGENTDEGKLLGVDEDVVTEVRSGFPEDEVMEDIDDEDIDSLVIGKRGRSDPDKSHFGTLTGRLIGHLDIPVHAV